MNRAIGVGVSCKVAKWPPWQVECRCSIPSKISVTLKMREQLNALQLLKEDGRTLVRVVQPVYGEGKWMFGCFQATASRHWNALLSTSQDTCSSATTLVSVWNTRVFRTALTALAEPRTLWQRIRRDPSPKRRVALHTSLAAAIIPCLLFLRRVALYITLAALVSGFLYFASGMWWRICTIRTTRMLHSSQGLQLCSSRLHNAWRCLCLSSADSHMPHSHLCLALRFVT